MSSCLFCMTDASKNTKTIRTYKHKKIISKKHFLLWFYANTGTFVTSFSFVFSLLWLIVPLVLTKHRRQTIKAKCMLWILPVDVYWGAITMIDCQHVQKKHIIAKQKQILLHLEELTEAFPKFFYKCSGADLRPNTSMMWVNKLSVSRWALGLIVVLKIRWLERYSWL